MAIRRILITGAGGFLGRNLLRELQPRLDDASDPLEEVRVLDLDAEHLPTGPGLVPFAGSITDDALAARACDGVDAVVHSASLIDWGNVPAETLTEVNVGGTRVMLEAARRAGVRSFVYTSSMDVVCGRDAVVDVNEDAPIPSPLDNLYCETKATAERLVLESDGGERTRATDEAGDAPPPLRTTALRPCGMYGEADPYHIKNTLEVIRAGKLSARPGDGTARFEHVYVGNVAHAHLLALDRLDAGDEGVCGEAFFITDDTPALDFLDFMEPIVEGVGLTLPPRTRRAPYPLMWVAAVGSELLSFLGRPFGAKPPVLTRSSVRFICKTHTFDGSKARRSMGYAPKYAYEDALQRTIGWWRDHLASNASNV
jgi:nucleoside-diphosphate-sugar epimerase